MREVVIFRVPETLDDDHCHAYLYYHHVDKDEAGFKNIDGIHVDAPQYPLVIHDHGRKGDAEYHIGDDSDHEVPEIRHLLGGDIPYQAVYMYKEGRLQCDGNRDQDNKLHTYKGIKSMSYVKKLCIENRPNGRHCEYK
jgi:hypothetical protein